MKFLNLPAVLPNRILWPLLGLLLNVACGSDPDISTDEYVAKARQHIAENRLDAGVIELKNALQIDNNLPEARWLLGQIYLKYGNGSAAHKELVQARTLGFENPGLDSSLLRALILQRKFEEVLGRTQDIENLSLDFLEARGNAFLGLGKNREARKKLL